MLPMKGPVLASSAEQTRGKPGIRSEAPEVVGSIPTLAIGKDRA